MGKVAIHLLLLVLAVVISKAQENESPRSDSGEYLKYPNCEMLDLAFIFDASDSIGPDNFNRSIKFVRNLLLNMNIGMNETRIAGVKFSRSQSPLFDFKESTSAEEVDSRLASATFGSGGKKRLSSTFSHVGLRTFSSKEGNRDEVPDMVIIFTDGYSNDRPQSKVSRLKRRGIRVAIVAMGDEPNYDIIDQIVSKPVEENVFRIGEIDRVIGAVRSRAINSCSRDAVVNQTTATEEPREIQPTEGEFVTEGPSNVSVSERFLSCFAGISVTGYSGMQNTPTAIQCNEGFLCAVVTANAIISTPDMEIRGTASAGECLPERVCATLNCDRAAQFFPPEFDIMMDGCIARCCNEDLCNTPDVIQTTTEVDIVEEASTAVATDSVVATTENTTRPPATITTTTASAPTQQEQTSAPLSFAQRSTSMTSAPSATPGETEGSATTSTATTFREIEAASALSTTARSRFSTSSTNESVSCLSGYRTFVDDIREDTLSIVQCQAGEWCGVFHFNVSLNVASFPIEGEASVWKCIQASECNQANCENELFENLPPFFPLTTTECPASCCEGSLCNVPDDVDVSQLSTATVSSPTFTRPTTPQATSETIARTRPVPITDSTREGLTCYTGASYSGMTSISSLQLRETTCDPEQICLSLAAEYRYNGSDINEVAVVSQCTTRESCSNFSCDQVRSFLPANFPIELLNCDVNCCDEDLCNVVERNETTLPQLEGGINCTAGYVISLSGSTEQDATEIVQCRAGYVCAQLRSNISISGSLGVSGDISAYSCLAPAGCSVLSCEMIRSVLPDSIPLRFSECEAFCCEDNLCNSPGATVSPTSIVQSTTAPTTSGLRCYTGLHSSSSRRVGSQTTVCGEGQVCSAVTASFQYEGSEIEESIALGQCVPAESCSVLNCSQVESFLPGSIVRLLTCRTTCCAENLCNVIEFNQTEADFLGGFNCTSGYITSIPGAIEQDTTSVVQCRINYICAEYHADISILNFRGTLSAFQCLPPAGCNALSCNLIGNALPDDTPVEFGQCRASCCQGNLCNTPGRATTSSTIPPTTIPESTHAAISSTSTIESTTILETTRLRCFSGVSFSASRTLENQTTLCGEGEVCSAMSVSFRYAGSDIEESFVDGQCISPESCSFLNCSQVENVLPSGAPVELLSCNASCCTQNLCNQPEFSETSEEFGGFNCTTGYIASLAGILEQDTTSISQCRTGYSCATLQANISILGFPGKISAFQCLPPAGCSALSCNAIHNILSDGLPDGLTFDVDQCEVSCCEESLCNSPGTAISPTSTLQSTTMPAETARLTCFTGVSFSASRTLENQTTLCGEGEVCSAFSASFRYNGSDSEENFVVGQCLIAEACSFLDCSQVNRFLPEDIPVQLLNCNASCCTENLCNQVEVNETSEEFIGINCTSGYVAVLPGIFTEDTTSIVQCRTGYSCAKLQANVSLTGFPGTISAFQCLPPAGCNELTCGTIRSALPDNLPFEFTECETSCCEENLCNAPGIPATNATDSPMPFTTTNPLGCGFIATATSVPQSFSSPNWPNNYSVSTDCTWVFTAQNPDERIQIIFESFSTEFCCDLVTISETPIDRYTVLRGNIFPEPYFSSTNQVSISFESDFVTTSTGFSATYRSVPAPDSSTTPTVVETTTPSVTIGTTPEVCGFNDSSVSRVPRSFSSPNFGNNYPNDASCSWIFTALPGMRIRIFFARFETEFCCDNLLIFENGILVERLRGTLFRYEYLSVTNRVLITFDSDTLVNFAGFNATYNAVDVPSPSTTTESRTSRAVTSEMTTDSTSPAGFAERVLEAIEFNQDQLSTSYVNWYAYTYDGNGTNILDGGNDMFDGGNMISVRVDDRPALEVVYNETYKYPGFEFGSYAGNPFVGIFWINDDPVGHSINIQVTGNAGADGFGFTATTNGVVFFGSDYRLEYSAFQIYRAFDPTICEVYFAVYSRQEWNTFLIRRPITIFDSDLFNLNTTVSLETGRRSLRNAMLGYTLLSRYPTTQITQDEIETVMRRMLQIISTVELNPSTTGFPASPTTPDQTTGIPTSPTTPDQTTGFSTSTFPPFTTPRPGPPRMYAVEILGIIRENANQLANLYPDWYEYGYDSFDNVQIADGGNDMFDGGNMLSVQISNRPPIEVFYNATYRHNNIQWGSLAGNPFVGIFWIPDFPVPTNITIRVTGDAGADGFGRMQRLSGALTSFNGRLVMSYNSFQIYSSFTDPTICEVFFEIRSIVASDPRTIFSSNSDRSFLNTTISIPDAGTGLNRNFIVGYTLLSRLPTALIQRNEIETFLNRLLNLIASNGTSVGPTTAPIVTTPFVTMPGTIVSPARGNFVATVASAVSTRLAGRIERIIPGWYNYRYDGSSPFNFINDGGEDMYDIGNQVSLYVDGEATRLTYNQSYRFGVDELISTATHPFWTLLWIENSNRELRNYTIHVLSDPGADGSGFINNTFGYVNEGLFVADYYVSQVSGASDASICEVYFLISSRQEWDSIPDSFNRRRISTGTVYLDNSVELAGRPSRVMIGYTLLSKRRGGVVNREEIQEILRELMITLAVVRAPEPTVEPFTPEVSTGQPATTPEPTTSTFVSVNFAEVAANAISSRLVYRIQSIIRGWYSYRYDNLSPFNYINDGGNDMYDNGNRVFLHANGNATRLTYNETYRFGDDELTTSATHPFLTLLWVENPSRESLNYTIQVRGDPGADGSGNINRISGSFVQGSFASEYHSFQVSGARDPTICEVYFLISNLRDWSSSGRYSFARIRFSTRTVFLDNAVQLTGRPSRLMMGYMLLSEISGRFIPQQEIDATLRELVLALDTVSPPRPDFTVSFTPEATTEVTATTPADTTTEFDSDNFAEAVAVAVSLRLSNQIKNIISGWYSYIYDNPMLTVINDGGNDMYDSGNRVFLYSNDNVTSLTYNQSYRFGDDEVFSIASHPFWTLLWVENADRETLNYTIQVRSDPGADGRGRTFVITGVLYEGSYFVRYDSFQVYDAFDPSICEVYFLITSREEWSSSSASDFTFARIRFSTSTSFLDNAFQLIGRPSRVMMGYVLLSKDDGVRINRNEIQETLRQFVIALDTVTPPEPIFVPTTPEITTTATDFTSIAPTGFISDNFAEVAANAISSRLLSRIQNVIRGWFPYRYDNLSPFNQILDGGDDMYDGGNQVYLHADNNVTRLTYNESYRFGDDELTVTATHPFLTLLWVENANRETLNYTIRVRSDIGADGSGRTSIVDGIVFEGFYHAQYDSFQVYDANDPSICEVYFLISNGADWFASPYNFTRIRFSNNTEFLDNAVQLTGRPSRVMMGYMLLSKRAAARVTRSEIEETLRELMRALNTVPPPEHIFVPSTPEVTTTPDFSTLTSTTGFISDNFAEVAVNAIASRLLNRIQNIILGWYNYIYDNALLTFIADGGSDMYDVGNEVFIHANNNRTQIMYNQSYRFGDDELTSSATHPFLTLLWVENPYRERLNYTIQVQSNPGADGFGNINRISGMIFQGFFSAQYYSVQISGAFDPSICEVYFVISNPREWSSVDMFAYGFSALRLSKTTTLLDNAVQLTGRPSRVMMGYTLLSKTDGVFINRREIEATLRELMVALDTVSPPSLPEVTTTDSTTLMPTSFVSDNFAEVAASAISLRLLDQIENIIFDWYNYLYDNLDPFNFISDGGNDMYDIGNEVYLHTSNNVTRLTYNQSYRLGDDELTTSATHPFLTLLWVENSYRERLNYTIQVRSDPGADGDGNINRQSGNVSQGFFSVQYLSFQISGALDPSICEVYFVISNPRDWYSSAASTYALSILRFSTVTSSADNFVELTGRPRRVMMGYMLLSKTTGQFMNQREIEDTLRQMMNALNAVPPPEEIFVPSTPEMTTTEFVPTTSTFTSDNFAEVFANAILTRLSTRTSIETLIRRWYNYEYDVFPPSSYIQDGGNDMYDRGNEVFLHVNRSGSVPYIQALAYNESYRFGHDELTTTATHPFLTLLWVENPLRERLNYTIQVRSNPGADGSGTITRNSGRVLSAAYVLHYQAFQVSGALDPSICEVYFFIINEQLWSSSGSYVFNRVRFSDNTNELDNSVQLSGNPYRAMMGYTLLSKANGVLITQLEITTVLREFLFSLSPVPPPEQVFVSTTPDFTTSAVTDVTATSFVPDNFAETAAVAISTRLLTRIDNVIRGWYNYVYDRFSPFNFINDGGNDMYDGGNQVFIHANGNGTQLTYNESYRFGHDELTTSATHPFLTLLWVENPNGENLNYTIQVRSDPGADGGGTITQGGNVIRVGSYVATYQFFQVSGATDPSICEVYFLISNEEDWSSSGPSSLGRVRFSTGTILLDNAVQLVGTPRRVMMGYTLLSKARAVFVTLEEIDETLREFMRALATVSPPVEFATATPKETTDFTTSTVTDVTATSSLSDNFAEAAANAVSLLLSNRIENVIFGWYNYIYDVMRPAFNRISDGGNDMYDGGNEVYLHANNNATRLTYNQSYRFGNDELTTTATHPFLTLLWVENANRDTLNYTIQVRSDPGADGTGSVTVENGVVFEGSYFAQYESVQVSGAFDPSICEVYFVISNLQRWSSSRRSSYTFSRIRFSETTRLLDNAVQLTGRPSRVMMGYTLLSKTRGAQVNAREIEETLRWFMIALNSVPAPEEIFVFTTPEVTTDFTTSAVTATSFVSDNFAEVVANAVSSRLSTRIQNIIRLWYNYIYDFMMPFNQISDGGRNMYDGGNQVYLHANNNSIRLTYNQSYRFGDDELTVTATHPFLALLWVENPYQERLNYTIQVRSDPGADGRGRGTFGFGSVSQGSYMARYQTLQVHSASNPSICEVYFVISSSRDWSSSSSFTYTFSNVRVQTNTRFTDNSFQLIGRPNRVMMGYMLLSKQRGFALNLQEVQSTLREFMIALSTVPPPEQVFVSTTSEVTSDFTTSAVTPTSFASDNFAETAVLAVSSSLRSQIASFIPQWWFYNYDRMAPFNFIGDGGGDMYDGGNQVFIHSTNFRTTQLTYNETYRFGDDEIKSVASYPFMALLWVENPSQSRRNYTIQVTGDAGADGAGQINRMSHNLTVGLFSARYHVFQVSGTTDPVICEVYFVISSHLIWRSNGFYSLNIRRFSTSTTILDNSVELVGSFSRTMMGYMLLSKRTFQQNDPITRNEIERVLRDMMTTLNSVTPPDFATTPFTFTTPFSTTGEGTFAPSSGFLPRFLSAFRRQPALLSSSYRNWYAYRYDGNEREIGDGGNDMFDGGNIITVTIDGFRRIPVEYNRTYEVGGLEFGSYAGNPFVGLFWVNDDPTVRNIRIQVVGNPGSDGRGRTSIFHGRISSGDFVLEYSSFQIYQAGDASICELYFSVYNSVLWGSRRGSRPFISFNGNTDYLNTTSSLRIGRNNLQNALFGYTLLSRFPATQINVNEIRVVAIRILGIVQSLAFPTPTTDPTTEVTTTETTSTEAPTTPFIDTTPDVTTTDIDDDNFARIAAVTASSRLNQEISRLIFGWFSYEYDGTLPYTFIDDGGNDTYDSGNFVFVYRNNISNAVVYDRSYRFGDDQLASVASHPFLTLLWIENTDRQILNYTIQVRGDAGADGSGDVSSQSGSVTLGLYTASYHVFQISGAGDPSICEVYFTIVSPRGWASSRQATFEILRFSQNTNTLDNAVTLIGRPRRVMMGYTLLSRNNGEPILKVEIEQVLRRMINALSSVTPPPFSTSPPPPVPLDARFLPSCTVSQAVNAIFRCQHVFARPNIFHGPPTCRSEINEAIRCVGNQLAQCRMGGMENVLDQFGFSFFNSKTMLTLLYNLTQRPESQPDNAINTFCFHAPRRARYPHTVENTIPFCGERTLNELVQASIEFYYGYTWARNRMDICSAFRVFKRELLNIARRCDTDLLYDAYLFNQAEFLRNAFDVAVNTAASLETTACADTTDDFFLDGFGTFGCMNSN